MLHFRSRAIDGVMIVEFIVPAICDGPEIEEMSEELHEMIGRSTSKRMILDMSSVRFIASRALSLVLSLKQVIDTHHGELALCGLRDQVLQVFRITGQDRHLALHPTRDRALAALGVTAA